MDKRWVIGKGLLFREQTVLWGSLLPHRFAKITRDVTNVKSRVLKDVRICHPEYAICHDDNSELEENKNQ